ncbi:hypothetical protein K502DRAFT_343958 [Neoconidiobolus thromboides FSU 785]|nr:hypothetical protein K502DRAFT_343958 [Neoconidiobolus thromboides FSU 785]
MNFNYFTRPRLFHNLQFNITRQLTTKLTSTSWDRPITSLNYKIVESDLIKLEKTYGKLSEYIKLKHLPLSVTPSDIFRISRSISEEEFENIEYYFSRDLDYTFNGTVYLKLHTKEQSLAYLLDYKLNNLLAGHKLSFNFIDEFTYNNKKNQNLLGQNEGSGSSIWVCHLPIRSNINEVYSFLKTTNIPLIYEDNLKLSIQELTMPKKNGVVKEKDYLDQNLAYFITAKSHQSVNLGYRVRYSRPAYAHRVASILNGQPFLTKKYPNFIACKTKLLLF